MSIQIKQQEIIMFEYINTGSMVIGGIICIGLLFGAILTAGKAIHENRKTKAPYFFLGAMVLIIASIIGEGISTKNTIEKNISQFQNGSELKCATFATAYLVSKKTGWKLHKEAFTKDSILLDAR